MLQSVVDQFIQGGEVRSIIQHSFSPAMPAR